MTLELLKAGLQKLVDEDNNQEAKQAIAEIIEIQQRAGSEDVWQGSCYVLHASTVDDLLNIAAYDEYGKLYVKRKSIGHVVTLNDYEKACRDNLGLDCIPLSAVQLGFEIVNDLYADNEADGAHNPDGTFRRD